LSNQQQKPETLAIGTVKLEGTSRSAWVRGERLELTTAEFNLLQHLMRNAGKVVSREEISAVAFGRRKSFGVDRNVDTLVSKLRRKMQVKHQKEDRIKTIRNVGYFFAVSSPTEVKSDRISDADSAQ
jgi:two-component system response regulator CpxR